MSQAKAPPPISTAASETVTARRAMLFWLAASGTVWVAVALSASWLF